MCEYDLTFYRDCRHGVWGQACRSWCNKKRDPGRRTCNDWRPYSVTIRVDKLCQFCNKVKKVEDRIKRVEAKLAPLLADGRNPATQETYTREIHEQGQLKENAEMIRREQKLKEWDEDAIVSEVRGKNGEVKYE